MARIRSLKAAVPYIELYDADMDNALGGDWYSVIWNNITYSTSDFTYQNDGTVLINKTGLYLVQCEAIAFSTEEAMIEIRVLLNNEEVEGAMSKITLLDAVSAVFGQLVISKILYIEKGDTISIKFFDDNTDADFAGLDYSRLIISYIPFGGWNNNNGGNIINRGIRR